MGEVFVVLLYLVRRVYEDTSPAGWGWEQALEARKAVFPPQSEPAVGPQRLCKKGEIRRVKLETHGPVSGAEHGPDEGGGTRITGAAVRQTWPEIPRKRHKPFKQGGQDRDSGNRTCRSGQIRRKTRQSAYPSFPFPVLKGIAVGKGIEPRPGMGVDAEIGSILLSKVFQAEEEDAVLEDVRSVPRVKGMTVTEHPPNSTIKSLLRQFEQLSGQARLI
jgi:hypothetical protein